MSNLADQKQRLEALNVYKSFIVQAPAGSGKTELLVQRSIKCLLNVSLPSQVLILTFTKKASQEINDRIKSYILNKDERHKRQPETQNLLEQLDKHLLNNNWDISSESNFDICKTFDSFTYQLADLNVDLVTHTDLLLEKITEDIFYGEDYQLIKDDLHHILQFINYDYEKLKKLLIDLIKKRDQWLSPLLDQRQSSKKIYSEFRLFLIKMIQQSSDQSFKALVNMTSSLLGIENLNTSTWSMDDWQLFINAFLTKKGTWRKRLSNIEVTKELKTEINELLSNQKNELAELIFYLNGLPDELPQKNLTIQEYLQTLLPKICAMVDIHMSSMKRCDFTFLTIKAIEQLKSEHFSQSNQYAMQINHILIDEFQDTSHLQAVLIESLTMHWHSENQNSLFIVGDPMQSIYKFRQADVRLFKQVQNKGLGHIKLTPLALTTNFRSSKTLIDHFNSTFKHIFPYKDDSPLGGISYHPSTSTHIQEGKVSWWDIDDISTIVTYLENVPNYESVAILARSRSHLLPIYELISSNVNTPGLFFLYEYSWIQEIAAILIAIYQTDDISSLAIQRLNILKKSWHEIFNEHILDQEHYLKKAIDDAKNKINDTYASELLMPILKSFLPNHYHHQITQFFLKQIDLMQEEDIAINRKNIQYLLNNTRPDLELLETSNIHLMTIHQSKGLEFDHVIIPSVHSRSMHDHDQLLHWFQYDPEKPMMIGNIQDHSDYIDTINNILRSLNQKSNLYEMQRLLYVAATRAKRHLIYVGKADKNNLSFAKFLKQSNMEFYSPSCKKIENKKSTIEVMSKINDDIQPINQPYLKIYKPELPTEKGVFGTAIHHVLETFISLDITIDCAMDNKFLFALCTHYNQQFKNTIFTELFFNLSKSDYADWLFTNCQKRWNELTLNGPDQKIIRIDYIFKKDNKLYIVDFKTNTNKLDQFKSQLSIYEEAVSIYLNQVIEKTLIFNPIENIIFDKFGKQVHLEMIM